MKRTERVAIEEHTERRILENSMRQAFRPTRVFSPRQLPTDHDYAVSTREYQSDQPSQKLLDGLLALSLSWGYPDWRSSNTGCCFSPFLLTPVSQNAPRRQGLRFAAPKPGVPLTAAVRSGDLRCLRRNWGRAENQHQNQRRGDLTGHSISEFSTTSVRATSSRDVPQSVNGWRGKS